MRVTKIQEEDNVTTRRKTRNYSGEQYQSEERKPINETEKNSQKINQGKTIKGVTGRKFRGQTSKH